MINEARVGYNRLGYNTVNPVKPVLPSTLRIRYQPPEWTLGGGYCRVSI